MYETQSEYLRPIKVNSRLSSGYSVHDVPEITLTSMSSTKPTTSLPPNVPTARGSSLTVHVKAPMRELSGMSMHCPSDTRQPLPRSHWVVDVHGSASKVGSG